MQILITVYMLLIVVNAVNITVFNNCEDEILLYYRHIFDPAESEIVKPGDSYERELLPNTGAHMMRAGEDPQATLAEFSTDAGKAWYDISIIPTGPGFCSSFEECKSVTGRTGFNLPMQITPLSNIGTDTCRVLTCLEDGCDDAYQFPKDDLKTHCCPLDTDFHITFCPDPDSIESKSSPKATANLLFLAILSISLVVGISLSA